MPLYSRINKCILVLINVLCYVYFFDCVNSTTVLLQIILLKHIVFTNASCIMQPMWFCICWKLLLSAGKLRYAFRYMYK